MVGVVDLGGGIASGSNVVVKHRLSSVELR